jgi:hypothetical protein
MALIFERQLELAAIGLDPAVFDDKVLLDDFGNPQVAQRLCGALNCDAGGILPGLIAGSHELDHLVDAVGHDLHSMHHSGIGVYLISALRPTAHGLKGEFIVAPDPDWANVEPEALLRAPFRRHAASGLVALDTRDAGASEVEQILIRNRQVRQRPNLSSFNAFDESHIQETGRKAAKQPRI